VVEWHVLRNALVLVITTIGLQFGSLMGAAVVVEKLFSWPGVGSLLIDSVFQRDVPTVQGCILLIVSFFLVINTLVDMAYVVLDPRVRGGVGDLLAAGVGGEYAVEVVGQSDGRLPAASAAVPNERPPAGDRREKGEQLRRVGRAVGGVVGGVPGEVVFEHERSRRVIGCGSGAARQAAPTPITCSATRT